MQFLICFLISFFVVAFGQPASLPICGVLAATFGYALFFVASAEKTPKTRFVLGTLFFTGIQLVQSTWLISHPYSYIYGVYFALAVVLGLQFGLLSYFASKERLSHFPSLFVLAALWTLLEWSRLFYFTGYTFNPIGLCMASSPWMLQCASFLGIFGLSFWVILSNAFLARCYFRFQEKKSYKSILGALCVAAIPFMVGFASYTYHGKAKIEHDKIHSPFQALLIHTMTLPEEIDYLKGKRKDPVSHAFDYWEQLINAIAPYQNSSVDLIVFPEIVVPFSAHSPIYEHEKMDAMLRNALDIQSSIQLAATEIDDKHVVSSASISQAIASSFGCPVLIGLEGREEEDQKTSYFNSAFFFFPNDTLSQTSLRYDKQVLFPLAEYIPATWIKPLAARYGLFDSFSHGTRPIIAVINNHKVAASICYEDTFANLMQKNIKAGATFIANLTNDGWYPNSSLGLQHLEHARVRAVENGVPLVRSCNFGISGAIDSLGNSVMLNSDKTDISAFQVAVSTYTHSTLYSRFGNAPIVILSILFLTVGFQAFRRHA